MTIQKEGGEKMKALNQGLWKEDNQVEAAIMVEVCIIAFCGCATSPCYAPAVGCK